MFGCNGIVLCRMGLGGVAHVDSHLLSERTESRFDWIETRTMIEVEKAAHIRLRDSETPCELRFTETGGLEISIPLHFSRGQRGLVFEITS